MSEPLEPTIDTLIARIRAGQEAEAWELLASQPRLACGHSTQSGQLQGATALHWAAHRNAVHLCARLIELGADVNDASTEWWRTPLAWAADAASAEAAELLLRHGADVNQDAIVGTTALHAVAMGGSSNGRRDPAAYQRTTEVLIAHGAHLNPRARTGRTPLDEAILQGNAAVEAVLRLSGAKESTEL